MGRVLPILLAALLPVSAAAEPCLPDPPPEPSAETAPAAASTAAEAEDRAWVDPGLEGKNVKVYFRDGRLYEGKLVELTDNSLRLKMGKRIETIALTEVARVERKPRRLWVPFAVVGVALGVLFVTLAIVVASSEG